MFVRRIVTICAMILLAFGPARAENDLEDLVLLTQDPGVNAALHQVGKVPLSTNTTGYDPCDDPIADPDRTTGCVANDKIEHVVYIILENHTFDNYYGNVNLGEVRVPGADVTAPSNDVPQRLTGPELTTPRTAASYRFPTSRFHLTEYCGWSDLGHGWDDIHVQTNQNKLDGYLIGSSTTSPSMGQFEEPDIAYYYALAQRFAIADRLFTSAATQSYPNHYYTVSATSGGYINNDLPVIQDPNQAGLLPSADPENGTVKISRTGHEWRTIFDALEEGGISWKIYMTNIAIPMAFSNFKKWVATGHVTTIAQYYEDLAANTLPQVTYLSPGILISDEHPGTGNHQRGQLQVSTLVNSLMASPSWRKSVMFVTYDDSGGWYDHVPAPRGYQPNDGCAGHPRATATNCKNGTWVPGSKAGYTSPLPASPPATGNKNLWLHGDNFDQLGARIPFTLVSPWLKGPRTDAAGYDSAKQQGYVTHNVYETATMLSFIEWRFGLDSLNDRTRAYKDGWRNPGCDWDVSKVAAGAPGVSSAESQALAWSAALPDPFRTVRCEPCPGTDPFCAPPNPTAGEADRAKDSTLQPITLAVSENRYLDPLLDPFDFDKEFDKALSPGEKRDRPGILDGAKLVTELPPLAETDFEEFANCPADGGSRSPLSPSEF